MEPPDVRDQMPPDAIGGTQVPVAHQMDDISRIPKPAKRNMPVLRDGRYVLLPPAPLKRLKPSLHLPLQPLNINTIHEKVPYPPQISVRTSATSVGHSSGIKLCPPATPAVKVFKENAKKSAEACENNNTKPVKTSKLSLKKTCPSPTISENQDKQRHQEILQQMLPPNYTHKVIAIEAMQPYHKSAECYDQSDMFTATMRVNLRTKQEAEQWLAHFQQTSLTDWRVRRCFAENTKCIIFKKGYRCHHNTQAQYRKGNTSHIKQTECHAFLYITVKNFNMTKSNDELLKEVPCEITLHHIHNHPIESADSLRHRRPTDKVVEIFSEMFRKEHSPASALSTHQYDIQEKHPENWFEILADGSECPNLQWCYHLYRKIFSKEYGPATGQGMVESLSAAVENYN